VEKGLAIASEQVRTASWLSVPVLVCACPGADCKLVECAGSGACLSRWVSTWMDVAGLDRAQ